MEQEYQHWLLALSAPMVALNIDYGARYDVDTFYPPGKTFNLKDSWDIASRDDLIAMINRMTDNGHAENLERDYHLWHRLSPEQWQEYCAGQLEGRQGVLTLVTETAALCGEAGIRAWDLGRMGFLCRVGQLNGWINQTESQWLHSRLAARANYYYRSWQQYYAAFFVGRTYWLALDEVSPEIQRYEWGHLCRRPSYVAQFNALYCRADSPIKHLRWDVAHPDMEKPASLQGAEV